MPKICENSESPGIWENLFFYEKINFLFIFPCFLEFVWSFLVILVSKMSKMSKICENSESPRNLGEIDFFMSFGEKINFLFIFSIFSGNFRPKKRDITVILLM